jgi:hypothetical protein
MTYWGNYKYNKKKIQFFSFENSSLQKTCFFWQKDPKKDNSHECKVNTLARYMSFGPLSTKNSLVKEGVTKPNSNAHKK